MSDGGLSSRNWTTAEDQELLKLRKELSRKGWEEVTSTYNDQAKAKGWSERSNGSLQKRHQKMIAEAKIGEL
jgi:hypothetical protein